jgi:hypothetical protein
MMMMGLEETSSSFSFGDIQVLEEHGGLESVAVA